jgi:hypothetical protein
MPPATDVEALQSAVERVIRSAVPPDQQVERRARPESEYSWREPTPAAGLRAALAVVELAQQQAYKFVRGLRSEGVSWREAADLLSIPWSDDYSRTERAYELVLGPDPEGSSRFHARCVYWSCGGPFGCGKYISDRGPYNGHPVDNEDGHAEGCLRLAAEGRAYVREQEEAEERDRVADKAMEQLAGDIFGLETAHRVRWVLAHGGAYQGWSTSETLAVALVLGHTEQLKEMGYSTQKAAMERVGRGMSNVPRRWLTTVRAAATGKTTV